MTGFPSPARLRFLLRNPRELWAAAGFAGTPGVPAKRARLAELRRDWRAALRLWRVCVEKTPNDPAPSIGYISALLSAGGIEEASERAAAFVRTHPADTRGPMLLARVAEVRGDFSAAIGHWQSALALKNNNPQALTRLGAALLKEGRFSEAQSCVEQLEVKSPRASHAIVLRAQIVQQQHGFQKAAANWESGLARFSKDAVFLRAYGQALLAAGSLDKCLEVAARLRKRDRHASLNLEGGVLAKRAPYQNHIDFWKSACAELPDSVDLTRKLLHAALSARDRDTANAAFRRLVRQDRLTVRDADMLVGLVNADLHCEEPSAAREKVRKYLKGMRGLPGYRAGALRLHRAILSSFPNRSDSARRISANIPVFAKMVGAARIGNETVQPLERVAALERALRESGAVSLLDSDIDADTCRAFIAVVRDRLRTGTPFSFVRLGDGEANALSYPSPVADHFASDVAEREKVW